MLAIVVVLGACDTRVIDLGRDASHDGAMQDASTCRCRLTPCRVTGDCSLIGGACGPDFYCVGDFGACATTAQCQATATDSVCTLGTTSTTPCP
jgi:hypothetical protein